MKISNASWARRQIAKHGVDRYPNWESQLRKLVEEVGELNKEMNRSNPGHPAIAEECADVALALYNFCDKVNINLDKAIESKVTNDLRKFDT